MIYLIQLSEPHKLFHKILNSFKSLDELENSNILKERHLNLSRYVKHHLNRSGTYVWIDLAILDTSYSAASSDIDFYEMKSNIRKLLISDIIN
jgi:hypothetical protein